MPFVISIAAVMVLSVVLATPVAARGTASDPGPASLGAEVSIGPIHLTGITPDTGPYTIITPSCSVNGIAPIIENGLTYSLSSAITGAIVDECPNSVFNGSGYTITPTSGTEFGVQVNTTSGVTVENVVVGGTPTEAVEVINSTDAMVLNATSSVGMDYGVLISESNGVNVSDSQLNDSANIGIAVVASHNISVWNTYASDGSAGFEDLISTGITLTNFSAIDNTDGIFLDDATDVALINDNVTGSSSNGVIATSSDNVTISNLNATYCNAGVLVELGDATTITDSNLSSATTYGFSGEVLDGLNVSNSNLSGAGDSGGLITNGNSASFWQDASNASLVDGLDLENVTGASVANSWAVYNGWNGLRVTDSSDVSSWGNVFDNSTNGTELVSTTNATLVGDEDTGDEHGVFAYSSSQIAITGLNSTNSSLGYLFMQDRDVTVTNSSSLQDAASVEFILSNDASVVNFTGDNSTDYGFLVEDSGDVAISNSVLVGSGYNPSLFGAQVVASGGNTLFNDSFTNFYYGIDDIAAIDATDDADYVTNSTVAAITLDGTSTTTVENGNYSSSDVGFDLSESGPLSILGNTFYNDSNDFGFMADELNGVQVYWNNFIDDRGWAIDASGSSGTNINFADGYPGGGNYWSNWTSPDTMSGPLQNLPGSDGIVDDPLPIQGTLEDPYPLTHAVSISDTSVQFLASGLPAGTAWTVAFNGTTGITTSNSLIFSTNTAAYGVSLGYTVTPPSGWTVSSPSGSIVTNGSPLLVALDFAPVTYSVAFTQTGLPHGTPWSVTINGTTYSGNAGSVTTSLPNGTYNYTVDPVAGYTVAPASGAITVASAGSSTPLTFSAVEYTVDFTEHGLPEGTTWSVTFNGQQKSLPSATISFAVANGSYAYSIGNVSGYSVAGGSGTQTVAGPGASVQIAFTANSSSGFGTSSPLFWALIAAIAILAVALIAVLLMGRRKPPASASAWTPPASGAASGASPPPPPPAGGAPTPPPGATGNPPDWKE